MTNIDPDAYGNAVAPARRPILRRSEPLRHRRIVTTKDEQLVHPGGTTETVPVAQRPRQITITRTTTFGTVVETVDAPPTKEDR